LINPPLTLHIGLLRADLPVGLTAGTDSHRMMTGGPGKAAHLMDMNTPSPALSGLEPLISVDELSDYLGIPVRTIYDWRLTGHGPRGLRVGRHLKFAVSDVAAWIDAQREASAPGDLPGA